MPEDIKPAAVVLQPGSPEYDAHMATIGRGMQTPAPLKLEGGDPPAAAVRPDHIPEKFWDAEKGEVRVDELAKSYGELERGRGVKTDPATKPQIPTGDPAQKAVENAGLDWDKVVSQVTDSGALDEETYKSLETAGIPKAIVDSYIELAKEASAALNAKAVAHAGGEEKLDALLDWAGKSLTDAEKTTYNKMLGTRDQWMVALDTLTAKMTAASKTAGEPHLSQVVASARLPLPATQAGLR
jgi:hypothetical protein